MNDKRLTRRGRAKKAVAPTGKSKTAFTPRPHFSPLHAGSAPSPAFPTPQPCVPRCEQPQLAQTSAGGVLHGVLGCTRRRDLGQPPCVLPPCSPTPLHALLLPCCRSGGRSACAASSASAERCASAPSNRLEQQERSAAQYPCPEVPASLAAFGLG